MALAHIRNGQIIRRYDRPIGWVELEDGSKASPPVAGFVKGNDKIVEIVEEITDTSAGGNAARAEEDVVEESRVIHRVTIRDKTPEELDGENEVLVLSQADQILGKALFKLLNDFRASQGLSAVTRAQFLTWLKAQA